MKRAVLVLVLFGIAMTGPTLTTAADPTLVRGSFTLVTSDELPATDTE